MSKHHHSKSDADHADTTEHAVKVYAWQGFTSYANAQEAVITDDDDTLDWAGRDSDGSETLTVGGDTHDVQWSGTIETTFEDSDGTEHSEEVIYSYTSDGYYMIPMAGSAFDEGSTVTGFAGGWHDTDGIPYDEVICYTPDCRIETARGPVAAGRLRPGDRVQTADNGWQPLVWVGQSTVPGLARIAGNLHPIRIRRDAFGPGCPARDMLVSPQHRICFPGDGLHVPEAEVFATAKALIDGSRVAQDKGLREITYVHLLCDRHEVLFSDGLATESFQPAPRILRTMAPSLRRSLAPHVRDKMQRAARPTLKPFEAVLLRDTPAMGLSRGLSPVA